MSDFQRIPFPLKFINQLFPLGIFLTISGGVLYLLRYDLSKYFNLDDRMIFMSSMAFLLYGGALLLFNYLRGSKYKAFESDNIREELYVLRNELLHSRHSENDLEIIKKEISSLQVALEKASSKSELVLSEEEKQEIKAGVQQGLTGDISNILLKELEDKYSIDIKAERQVKLLREQLDRTRSRLRQEIEALGRRGNVNLVIGVLTTIVAIGILASTVLSQEAKLNMETLVSHFLPRFTLSIFIEIFSFFFLKLYKSGLSEIKYFQNELTNVEAKFVALENAFLNNNGESLHTVITDFAKTERNFVLSKGQSTVEIEKMKVEKDSTKNMLSVITDLSKLLKK